MPQTVDSDNRKRRVSIGRREKNKRRRKSTALEVSKIHNMMINQSVPEQGILARVGYSTVEFSNEAIGKAITDLLDTTCGSDNSRKRSILVETISKCNTVPPVVTPNKEGSSSPIQWNPRVFYLNRSVTAATSQKSRLFKNFSKAMEDALSAAGNTLEEKLVIFHEYLERHKDTALVSSLITSFSACIRDLPFDTFGNMKEIVSLAKEKACNNDSKAFNATLLLSMVSNEPMKRNDMAKLSKFFGLSLKVFTGRFKDAVVARKNLLEGTATARLVQTPKRKSRSIVTPELIAEVYEWLMYKCEEVKASPKTNHTVLVKNPYTGVKEKQQKHFYMNSVREIHNQLIRPVEEGGFQKATDTEGKVVISDTMLRSLLPANLSRLTESHKELCGCENCIVSKGYCQTVNGFETRLSKQLPTAEAVAFKAAMHQYSHPREAAATIACAPKKTTQGPWPLHKFSCAMGHCQECKDKVVPGHPRLLDTSARAKDIAFHEYKPWSFCSVHKTLAGAPTSCPQCKEQKQQKPNYKVGKLHRKSVLTTMHEKVGVMWKDFFTPFMRKYKYHALLVDLLGKYHAIELRDKSFTESIHSTTGDVITVRDYAEGMKIVFDQEIQSTHFGYQPSVSLEGCVVKQWQRPAVGKHATSTQLSYHCYLSDDKRQDARTTYINTVHMIKKLRSEGYLEKGTTLWEQMDGCAKQYRCGTALYLMSVISMMYDIKVNRMISAPSHGKAICDSQGGVAKSLCSSYMKRIAQPETDNDKKYLSAELVNAKVGGKVSMAELFHKVLSDPKHSNGAKGDRKSAKREYNSKIQHRYYTVMHHGNTDQDANSYLPIPTTKFVVASGFEKSTALDKYWGIGHHYHFYCCPQLGLGKVAARRIPCSCQACYQQLNEPWEEEIQDISKQPRFQKVQDCIYKEVFEGYNEWKIISLKSIPTKDAEEDFDPADEMEELFNDILGEYEIEAANQIEKDMFGAYQTEDPNTDGFYIIQWMSHVYRLEEDSYEIEGMDGNKLEAGSQVADGLYWNPVPRAKDWYTPPQKEQVFTFRVRYVLKGDLYMLDQSESYPFPNNRRDRETVLKLKPCKISAGSREQLNQAMNQRKLIDFIEGDLLDSASEGGEEEDTDDDSDSETSNHEGETSDED